jgi:hypothetical protein
VPRARVAVFRVLVYLFVVFDVLYATSWVGRHGWAPSSLYEPIGPDKLLPLPVPTESVVTFVQAGLVVTAVLAMTGRLPRLLGWTVAALYIERMLIAYGYGKVDHDRFAVIIALVVLPSVGRVRWGDRTLSEAAGWALRCVQLAVVATYFLAAFAKFRYGDGLAWMNSTTLLRAVVRRGTWLADPLVEWPVILHATQYGIILLELASPLVFVRRFRTWMLATFAAFHAVTYAMLTIIFLPHVVCLASFLPLERLVQRRARDEEHGRGGEGDPDPGPGRERAKADVGAGSA